MLAVLRPTPVSSSVLFTGKTLFVLPLINFFFAMFILGEEKTQFSTKTAQFNGDIFDYIDFRHIFNPAHVHPEFSFT